MKWIPVEEQLPGDTNSNLISYLGSTNMRYYTLGYYLGDRWIDERGNKKAIKDKVTHWMPFPTFERMYDKDNI